MKINEEMLRLYLSLSPLPLVVERLLRIRSYQSRGLRRLVFYISYRGGFLAKAVFGDKQIGISFPVLFASIPHLGHRLPPLSELAPMDQSAVHRPPLRIGHQLGDQY
jgi:hypothetical protein